MTSICTDSPSAETFADTFYFLALLNPRDQAHARAQEVGAFLEGRLVTTEYILIVMSKRGITDALTGDVHFRQAGFNALL